MSRYDQGQEEMYDGSAYDPAPPAHRVIRDPRDRPQQQGRPTSQRSNLPSQQRAAPQPHSGAYSGQPSRQGPPRMQSQDHGSQWPLVDSAQPQHAVTRSQRGPPPPRPPRPSQIPLVLGTPLPASNRGPPVQSIPQYRADNVLPSNHYAEQDGEDWEDEYGSPTYPAPNMSRPLTGSSRASTSSNYSLPDFPVPQIPPQIAQLDPQSQNRRPPLGPPPSARRGPLSYYPQTSFVPPIVEETDSVYSQSTRAPHDSYASSNAIPIGISEFYLDNRHAPISDDDSPFNEEYEEDPSDDSSELVSVVPVRQASIGKRSRPTMTTIKSNESMRPDSQTRPLSTKTQNSTESADMPMSEKVDSVPLVPLVPGSIGRSAEDERPEASIGQVTANTNNRGALGRSPAMTTDPSSESERSLKQKKSRELLAAAREQVRTRSPLAQTAAGVEHDYNGSEKTMTPNRDEQFNQSEKKGSLAQRVGSRRPPRLNVDAVKEAEARGSLTSLPDLILRATKLASNLDRGRTASRLGMDWFGDEAGKSQSSGEKRKSGNSLSDILASFPPPGLATPTGSRGSRGVNQWPSRLQHSSLPSESDPGEAHSRKRRCCGMPLWVFLILLVILLLAVAAAVVIPVVLVVLPNQKSSGDDTSKALASCQKSLTCQNGGTNIITSSGSCSCLCVNGFTGSQCATKSSTGCTTTDVDGATNVTVGNAIPRLLEGAQSNFSVPLNGSSILALFSSNDLSCTSENALVTFNGLTSRSLDLRLDPIEEMQLIGVIPTTTLKRRQDAMSATSAAATSNGIVFDNTPTATSSSSATASATATTSALSSSSNSTMLDFARIAVLYVMQDSGKLDTAVTAQESLQDYFTSGTTSVGQTIDATNITLASGYTANLQEHTITTAGGSSVGG